MIPFDVAALRAEFPVLGRTSRGKPLVYLDSAATSQKPQVVIDAVRDFYTDSNANIHRGVYELSEQATLSWDAARGTVARFLGGVPADEIVFVRGTTEAINLVAHSFLAPRLRAGDHVLVTTMEHHSNIVPWQLAGAITVPIPLTGRDELDLDAARALLARGPRLLALTHLSNALGTINPVAQLTAMAREYGVPVLVDGAQAAPHLTLDIPALDCDFYCFSGHKVFGPTGIGALWARSEHLAAMPPWQGGGDMIDQVTFGRTTFALPPARFEAGTPHIAGAVGLAVALQWLMRQDRAAIQEHEHRLLEHGRALLAELPGVELFGRGPNRAAVLTFTVDGVHPHDLASLLDQDGICIRAGHHCTQPLHRHLDVAATARASIGPYNTFADLTALAASVHRAQEVFA